MAGGRLHETDVSSIARTRAALVTGASIGWPVLFGSDRTALMT